MRCLYTYGCFYFVSWRGPGPGPQGLHRGLMGPQIPWALGPVGPGSPWALGPLGPWVPMGPWVPKGPWVPPWDPMGPWGPNC